MALAVGYAEHIRYKLVGACFAELREAVVRNDFHPNCDKESGETSKFGHKETIYRPVTISYEIYMCSCFINTYLVLSGVIIFVKKKIINGRVVKEPLVSLKITGGNVHLSRFN
jgi:hypothetical protein